MIKNLVTNWKTSSLGLTMIIGAVTHLAYKYKSGGVTEGDLTAAITAMLTGVGLIIASDGDKSATKAEAGEIKQAVAQNTAALQATPLAIKSGDTSIITRAMTQPQPATTSTKVGA